MVEVITIDMFVCWIQSFFFSSSEEPSISSEEEKKQKAARLQEKMDRIRLEKLQKEQEVGVPFSQIQ